MLAIWYNLNVQYHLCQEPTVSGVGGWGGGGGVKSNMFFSKVLYPAALYPAALYPGALYPGALTPVALYPVLSLSPVAL